MKWASKLLAAGLCCAAAPLAAQELRLGLLTNVSGTGALQGVHQRNGWLLGLEHEGWRRDGDKIHGLPTRIVYGDDQGKPDIGLREIDKMIQSDKVQVVAGFLWSNVLMATRKPLVDAKKVFISTSAGASPLAGKECTPYFISLSWQNDTIPEATGLLVDKLGIKSVVLMVPNYQAGKDMVSGFQRTFKGKIADQLFFKLGETDFQADISKVRALKPEAVFIFAPGAMGISFMKQWVAAGIGKEVKLFSAFTVDWITLPAIGEDAVGTDHVMFWDPNGSFEANQRFVKEYVAKFGHMPSMFAVPAYDAARMIAAGVKAVNGKVDDTLALAKAMRRAEWPSPRGPFKINVNGFPIQTHYRREVVKRPDGKLDIVATEIAAKDYKDPYWEQCPPENRF